MRLPFHRSRSLGRPSRCGAPPGRCPTSGSRVLPHSPADEGVPGRTRVVGLQSLDEDRLGQELTVVWELEVGHTVAPNQGLPEIVRAEAFDDPNTLAAFVDAVRWGAVTSADANSYQAPFRSGANVEAYQLVPLSRALQSSRTNLLLADDVGPGKTIEAGLVVQELLLRHRARSVVIVCPPSLSLKWQDEMREKFGLDFVIVNSELMAKVRRSHGLNANPFRLFPRVIVSMAWLPSLRAQRLLRDVLADVRGAGTARRYAFDVLVVDEAHHVAPASPTTAPGRRGYAVDSKRTTATMRLAEACEHRLFLSATPHSGYSESFTALLEMIDGSRFTRGARIDGQALKEVMVRWLKADLPDKGFKTRKPGPLPFTPSEEEQQQFARLERLLADSARANGKGSGGDIVAMLLKKRFLSSPWSFARTLELYEGSDGGDRQLRMDDEDQYYTEVLGSGQSDEEEGAAEHAEFTTLRPSKGSDPLVAATRGEIASRIEWGRRHEHEPDSRGGTADVPRRGLSAGRRLRALRKAVFGQVRAHGGSPLIMTCGQGCVCARRLGRHGGGRLLVADSRGGSCSSSSGRSHVPPTRTLRWAALSSSSPVSRAGWGRLRCGVTIPQLR